MGPAVRRDDGNAGVADRRSRTDTSRSKHMPLDPELRKDLARDLLDRRVRRVLHRDAFAAEDLVGLAELPAALLERRVLAAGPPRLAHLRETLRIDREPVHA